MATVVAGCAGLPLVAAGLRWPNPAAAMRLEAAAVLAGALALLAMLLVMVLRWAPWSQFVPLSATLLLAAAGLRSRRWLVLSGAAVLIVAFVTFAGGWTVPRFTGAQQLHLLTAAGMGVVGVGAGRARGHRRHEAVVGG